MNKILTLLIFFTLSAINISQAQLTLTPDTSTAEIGGKAYVKIKVKGFNNLVGMQYSLNWNPAVLKYDTVSSFNVPGISTDMIGADPDTLATGKIGLLWTSFQPNGNKLADGSSMLTFVFDVVGSKGQSTLVHIGDSPVFAEAYDTTGADIGVIKGTGKVTINFPSKTNEKFAEVGAYKMYNPEPNPFNNVTNIITETPKDGVAQMIISDMNGKQVFISNPYLHKGQNNISVNRKDLPSAGSYVVTLNIENTILTRKIILIQ